MKLSWEEISKRNKRLAKFAGVKIEKHNGYNGIYFNPHNCMNDIQLVLVALLERKPNLSIVLTRRWNPERTKKYTQFVVDITEVGLFITSGTTGGTMYCRQTFNAETKEISLEWRLEYTLLF